MTKAQILEKIQDKVAAHYSLSGSKKYDEGFNDAVKIISECIRNVISNEEKAKRQQWYNKTDLDQLSKSY